MSLETIPQYTLSEQGGFPRDCFHLQVPGHWKTLAFMSDVHLHAADTATFEAWATAIRSMEANALFILGDLFEVWVGDDVLSHPTEGRFWSVCAHTLSEAARRMSIYFMPGNRDFLVGSIFLTTTGMQPLPDPTLLKWPQTSWLLSHGDLLCTDDHAYQAFRTQVRTTEWQSAFLARPLSERLEMARYMRMESAARQAQTGSEWTDVNVNTVEQWLSCSGADTLIHGHTHLPAIHTLHNHLRRVVLSDWDANTDPPRMNWLETSAPLTADCKPIFQIKTSTIA